MTEPTSSTETRTTGRRGHNLLPSFSPPIRRSSDPDLTAEGMDPNSLPTAAQLDGGDVGADLPTLEPTPDGTRTRTSDSPGKAPTKAEITGLVAAVLAALAGGIAVAVRWRRGVRLRRPTGGQLREIAEPVGSILVRHLEITRLHGDLVDGLKAGAALSGYLEDGPLLEYVYPDPGIPDDLQEVPA
jgi:hypothetical protein